MTEATPPRPLAAGRGSRNESTRRHNLSTLLSLVHHRRSASRAELTRLTGLNRSTIGALVADLAAAGLVEETAPATGTVGRPSPIIRPDSRVTAIAVNPDVDAILVGLVGLGGVVHGRRRIALADVPSVDASIEHVRAAVAALTADAPVGLRVVGTGIAVPGLVRTSEGVVTRAPHLLWRDEPVAAAYAEAFGVPAAADNDANTALAAETLFGAGRERSDLIYLNGSTSGIGGGVLVGGAVLRGADGFAGELGHTLVTPGGEDCHCGRSGCLETEVNLQRLEAAAGDRALNHDDLDTALAGELPPALGDEIDRQVDVLARAIASFVSVFNPESAILGGFLGTMYALRTERLEAAVAAHAFSPLADGLRIERAALRDELLMVGAAELAFASLLADPLGER
ncbi:ROK family transcriptional regulator [Demequina muriae]|uniref:ROK family transcriptional regulator n=1 Tax=Demequina muriae TaxID=3051664 RepID=A0ABT8GHE8_9MICO|nr:ROK family transcriptional regulator [Demequina sp. EGI L300058]MDN4480696.1 ROK family transcriptional regulator [Demequina sp. EGI L300058]